MENQKILSGMITSRKCPACGHHEIGFTTGDGTFLPLKPGDLIQVLKDSEISPDSTGSTLLHKSGMEENDAGQIQQKIWIPDPVKGDKTLRLKYGVMVKEPFVNQEISGEIYRAAYLEKLRRLIEKEITLPIPVILDRFFTAPHLASGNPREVAEAMWRDLDEVKAPVLSVRQWLDQQDEESHINMILPRSEADLDDHPVSTDQQQKELEELTFEEFLEILVEMAI